MRIVMSTERFLAAACPRSYAYIPSRALAGAPGAPAMTVRSGGMRPMCAQQWEKHGFFVEPGAPTAPRNAAIKRDPSGPYPWSPPD